MIEAGAPLPYVMSQVGHADSRTTLEIYAQVQKRLSRKKVHRAFDDLLAAAGDHAQVPTDGRDKMSQSTVTSSFGEPENGKLKATEVPGGPRTWSANAN